MSTDEQEDNFVAKNFKLHRKMVERRFGHLLYKPTQKFTKLSTIKQFPKPDLTGLFSMSKRSVAYYHYLKRKELFQNSVRKLKISGSIATRLHSYQVMKAREEYGFDTLGIYVIDSKNSANKF